MNFMPMVVRRPAALAAMIAVGLAILTGVFAITGATFSAPPSDSIPTRDSAKAFVSGLLGLSGELRAVELDAGVSAPSALAGLAPALGQPVPGVHPTGLVAPDGDSILLLASVSLDAKLGASWRGYRVGFWPGERASIRSRSRYPLPAGFLEVTPNNQNLALSTHFRLRDFLAHDQQDTWPKVLVVRLSLVDKLELIGGALEALGRPAAIRVMSGFRTPQYNAQGVGRRGGRARDSRHMYGDAADIYVDTDGDGRMDDLDGDGRVTVRDAGWLAAVAAQVDADHPMVTGGIGVYRANSAHGPFVHVDTRGTPARW
jgi:uncharacterized protein YcbK (DUF882 family)